MSVAEMSVASDVQAVNLEELVTTMKSLDTTELFKLLKAGLAEAEKKAKTSGKAAKVPKMTAKKAGSMPKGVVPPQLRKPRAWVQFVLEHAQANGWEAFTVHQTHKDKETGDKVEEEIAMPASILHEGAHVYEDSITEAQPGGRQIINKDAMSLSKHYWAPKDGKGTRPELYAEFEAQYVDDSPVTAGAGDAASVSSGSSKGSKVIKKTAAEKAAEAEAKKVAAAAKKAEKEAEKEAKKAEKEAEKDAKKAEKEAEKAAKKAEKDAAKAPKAKSAAPVPAAAVKKADAAAAAPAAQAAAPKAAAKPKPKPVAPTAAWTCPADGMVHPWPYKGKDYLRNSDNEVWLKAADGGCGEWQGIYRPGEDRIDDSVAEPVFADDE